MKNYNLSLGQLVGVVVNGVLHLGVVSFTYAGVIHVISSSRRRGGAFEEPLDAFLAGGELVVLRPLSPLSPSMVVANARQRLGCRWDLFSANCEHFVYQCFGLKPQSPQLRGALTFAACLLGVSALVTRA